MADMSKKERIAYYLQPYKLLQQLLVLNIVKKCSQV